jgi:hypothetical protein
MSLEVLDSFLYRGLGRYLTGYYSILCLTIYGG